MNLQDKILNKIENEKLEPTPLSNFLFKKYTIYFTLLLSVVFSSFSFAALSFILANLDWKFYKDLEENLSTFALHHFPFFWIFLSVVFVALSIYIWKNSPKGYKYSGRTVFAVLALFVIVFGSLLNIVRLGKFVDNQFANSQYRPSFEEKRERVWNRPDKQRILGVIKDVDNENGIFVLEDRKFLWEISISDIEVGQEHIIFGNKVKMLCRYAEQCQLIKFD